MNLVKHCELCDNKLFDFANGTTCGLTGEKPTFKDKCPDIKFEENYESQIREINTEHHLVKITKANSIANFIVYLVISLTVMAAGYLIGKLAWDKGVISTVPLIIMGLGVLILPLAAGPLNKYRFAMSVAGKKKADLDNLLARNNIKYDIEVIVNKDFHGNQETETKLQFLRKYNR